MFLNLVVLSSTPWPEHLSPRWGRVALLSHETHTSAPEKERMLVTLFNNSNLKFITSDQFLCLLVVLAGLHGLLHLEHHAVPTHGCNEMDGQDGEKTYWSLFSSSLKVLRFCLTSYFSSSSPTSFSWLYLPGRIMAVSITSS